MEHLYQQALAAMPVEGVRFILSQIETAKALSVRTNSSDEVIYDATTPDEDEDGRRRRHIEREWPEVGTELTADYCNVSYGAEIITATKRLKSGRQIRITSGAAKGTVCDSFSEAMLTTTEDQREKENLGRKGVSNGWLFWQWDGKPDNISSDDSNDTD